MKQSTVFFITFFWLLTSVKPANAELVINEFSSSDNNDWVEVYFVSEATAPAQLANYRIRDGSDSNKIDLEGELAPGEYKAFGFGNRLNNDGDDLRLYKIVDGTEIQIDQISYGKAAALCAPESGQSIGRMPDGTGPFTRLASQTKGAANSSEAAACPTPTPSATPRPSNTPTPSPTESPTPSAAPTKSPLIAPTPKPTQKPTPTPEPSGSPTPSPVLTQREGSPSPTVLVATDSGEEVKGAGNFSPFAVIMIVAGVVLIGASALGFVKSRHESA